MKALLSLMLGGALFVSAAASGPVIAAAQWQAGNSDSTGDQDNVAIAANRSGHVAIVWEDDRDTATPGDNVHSDIWVRLFKDGTSVYEKKLSAGGTAGVNWRHLQPDVGLDDNGNAVIVWADDPDGNGVLQHPDPRARPHRHPALLGDREHQRRRPADRPVGRRRPRRRRGRGRPTPWPGPTSRAPPRRQ